MFRNAVAILTFSTSLLVAITGRTAPHRFDVRTFGAVGDGIADDQPAIKKAVEAVGSIKAESFIFRTGFIVARGNKGCRTQSNSAASPT